MLTCGRGTATGCAPPGVCDEGFMASPSRAMRRDALAPGSVAGSLVAMIASDKARRRRALRKLEGWAGGARRGVSVASELQQDRELVGVSSSNSTEPHLRDHARVRCIQRASTAQPREVFSGRQQRCMKTLAMADTALFFNARCRAGLRHQRRQMVLPRSSDRELPRSRRCWPVRYRGPR